MTRQLGATEAFNTIVQKIDEALIQAEAHFRHMRLEGDSGKSTNSVPDVTIVPSPNHVKPESSFSIPAPTASKSARSSRSRLSSVMSERDINVKSKSYMALDKKKAIVVTSFKSKVELSDSDVTQVQKLIEGLFGKDCSASSSASSPSVSFINM